MPAGGGGELRAVLGEQSLVRRDHMLAGRQGVEHQPARGLGAADRLDDQVDLRVVEDAPGVGGQGLTRQGSLPSAGKIAHQSGLDDDRPARPASDPIGLLVQQPGHARADRSQPQQTHPHRRHGRPQSSRNFRAEQVIGKSPRRQAGKDSWVALKMKSPRRQTPPRGVEAGCSTGAPGRGAPGRGTHHVRARFSSRAR